MTTLSETPLHRGDVIEFPSYDVNEEFNDVRRLNSTNVMRKPVSAMVTTVVLGKCEHCGCEKQIPIKVGVYIIDHNATETIDDRIKFRVLARK